MRVTEIFFSPKLSVLEIEELSDVSNSQLLSDHLSNIC
jgi:hypothetical protein